METSAAASSRLPLPVELVPALETLPPFPAVALRALNVLSGTDTSLRELCEVIRPDPVFSAETLRIANSPLIAFSKEVTSVLQASMLLGFRRLRRLVITIGMRSYLNQGFTNLLQPSWRHSVACAMVAERTARWNSIDRDTAYTAGILHDIGRVAMVTLWPDQYGDLITKAMSPSSIVPAERNLFGLDHCEVGHMLLTAWKLPEGFSDAARCHHDPLSHTDDLNEVTRLSCQMASALGFPAIKAASLAAYQSILLEFPEGLRSHLPNLDELKAEIRNEISVIEGTLAGST